VTNDQRQSNLSGMAKRLVEKDLKLGRPLGKTLAHKGEFLPTQRGGKRNHQSGAVRGRFGMVVSPGVPRQG